MKDCLYLFKDFNAFFEKISLVLEKIKTLNLKPLTFQQFEEGYEEFLAH